MHVQCLKKNECVTIGTTHQACLVLQVFSTLQLAKVIVHCYPYLPSMERLLEAVAVRESAAGLSANLQVENEQALAEWTAFSEYVALLAINTYHDHFPLLPFLNK